MPEPEYTLYAESVKNGFRFRNTGKNKLTKEYSMAQSLLADPIVTERLILRQTYTDLVPELTRYYVENLEYFAPYDPFAIPELCSEERRRNAVESEITKIRAGRGLYYYVFTKDDPSRLIGTISFVRIRPLPYSSTIFGYDLAHEAWGRGYMTESCRAALSFLFEHTSVNRIEARVSTGNSRSVNVLERLGFTFEGREYKSIFIDGEYRDHFRYSLLRSP